MAPSYGIVPVWVHKPLDRVRLHSVLHSPAISTALNEPKVIRQTSLLPPSNALGRQDVRSTDRDVPIGLGSECTMAFSQLQSCLALYPNLYNNHRSEPAAVNENEIESLRHPEARRQRMTHAKRNSAAERH